VKVIDEEGGNLGEMSLQEALIITQQKERDLVELTSKLEVPVCKIMDYGKFLYREAKNKKKQEAHSKKNKLKIVRINIRTGKHDMEIKAKKALDFLHDGDMVRIDFQLKGRERSHMDFAKRKLEEFMAPIKPFVKDSVERKFTPSGFEFDLKLDLDKLAKLKKEQEDAKA
jgi:translation initiation factor IF-3